MSTEEDAGVILRLFAPDVCQTPHHNNHLSFYTTSTTSYATMLSSILYLVVALLIFYIALAIIFKVHRAHI